MFFYVRRFPQKTEGSTAGRLPMFFDKKNIWKCCIKQSTTKRNKNRKLANLHRKNDLLKATIFRRHKDYYGFVKSRSFRTRLPGMAFWASERESDRFWHHFATAEKLKRSQNRTKCLERNTLHLPKMVTGAGSENNPKCIEEYATFILSERAKPC